MVTPHRFVLHIDGKHKLHHGKWMLVSIGTHDLRFDEEAKQLSHSYRPLVYMFVKQQETTESVKMLCEALDLMAYTRYGVFLKPGTVNMDHSNGFRQGVLDVWPDTGTYSMEHIICISRRIMRISGISCDLICIASYRIRITTISRCITGIITCWPHLKRKIGQGEYLSTTHPFYEPLCEIMDAIHRSQSADMQDLLSIVGGEEIHPEMSANPKLRTLWNEYCVQPWNCWSIGLHTNTPLNIANNQPIESWHRGVMKTLQRALKGSTAAVLENSFPKLVHKDSITRISNRITLYRAYIIKRMYRVMYHVMYHIMYHVHD